MSTRRCSLTDPRRSARRSRPGIQWGEVRLRKKLRQLSRSSHHLSRPSYPEPITPSTADTRLCERGVAPDPSLNTQSVVAPLGLTSSGVSDCDDTSTGPPPPVVTDTYSVPPAPHTMRKEFGVRSSRACH